MPSRLGDLNGLIDFHAFRISNSVHLEFAIIAASRIEIP